MTSETVRASIPAGDRFLDTLRRYITQLRRPDRQLRLCESLSLGDKRIVAIVQFGRQRYLVGATSASISLLSQLPNAGSGCGQVCPEEGGPCEP
jgi:flagellar biogenesis protein FliO